MKPNQKTLRILVCRPNNPEGAMVAIVVNTSLFVNALSNEILRLKSDLEAENYTAKIKLWPSSGTSASNVWSYLRENYTDTNAFFVGAILIGVIPKPQAVGIYNDLIYWNMDAFQTSSSRVYSRHIWVSFIKVEDLTWGSEVTLIRRALDANHAYRRGQSRLPFTAYRYKNPDWWSNRNYLSNVWPVVEQRGETSTNLCFLPERKDLGSVAGADCLVKGGELFEEESHGNGLGYMSSYGWVTKQEVHRNLVQVRVCLLGSCSSGVSGGIANEHIYSRGGGCVLAVGSTEDNFPSEGVISDDASFLSRLQAGRSWGDALVENFTIGQYANSALFGDLSLRPMASGELNLMPEIGHFGASTSNAMIGQSVNFEVTASDPDGSVSNIEWFLNGFDGGRATPTFIGMATNVSYAYSSPGVYTTRVEVVDNYQARTWRESIITVTPLQTCTLMVVNSGQGGSSLGVTSPAKVTLPWGSSTQIVFEASDWYRIQALASNNISIEAAIGAKIYTQAYVNITANISNDVTFALATPLQTGYSNVPTSWLTNWAENAILIDPQFTVYEKYLIGLDPSTSNTFSLAIESVRVCESNVIMVLKRQYTGGLSPDGMHGHTELQATDRMDVPFTNVPGTEVTGIAVFDDTGRKTYTNSLTAATNQFYRAVVQ